MGRPAFLCYPVCRTGRAAPGGKTAKKAAKLKGKESGRMERARSNAYGAALPGGGR